MSSTVQQAVNVATLDPWVVLYTIILMYTTLVKVATILYKYAHTPAMSI